MLTCGYLPDSKPSVYQLKPANEDVELSACLFTDYSPDNIEVSADGSEFVKVNSSVLSVEGKEASYGTVLWNNQPKHMACVATYNGEKFMANSGTADVCSEKPISFQTDERLNLLSLTVLGLRVIFFKSVALNLLLTLRLWSRGE
ncbi:hypothetical protein lerEdw1_011603 [Lerista edwardsae]|nr:hypothetical protein lerEdw1_011603 [Lerista edwardsae]